MKQEQGRGSLGTRKKRAFCERELLNAMAARNDAACSLTRVWFFRRAFSDANGPVRGEHEGIAVDGNAAASDEPDA